MKNLSIRGACLPMVLLVAACGSVPHEVVPLRDGTYRAPSHVQAEHFCQQEKGSEMQPLKPAPGEPGIIFRCR